MREKLESVLESIEESLGEYSGVTATYCPEWAVPLKTAQDELHELIHDAEIEEEQIDLIDNTHIRGFHWSNKAWYAEANGIKNGEITFGIYCTEGGCTGEMTMKWFELCGKLVPKLGAFEDSWNVLSSFKDVIDALGKVAGKNITEDEFVKILLGCGFTDLTAYTEKNK